MLETDGLDLRIHFAGHEYMNKTETNWSKRTILISPTIKTLFCMLQVLSGLSLCEICHGRVLLMCSNILITTKEAAAHFAFIMHWHVITSMDPACLLAFFADYSWVEWCECSGEVGHDRGQGNEWTRERMDAGKNG